MLIKKPAMKMIHLDSYDTQCSESTDSTNQPSCPICLAQLEFLTSKDDQHCCTCALLCGHTFHVDCLTSWLETDNACPVCRKGICEESKITRLYFGPESEFHYQKPKISWNIYGRKKFQSLGFRSIVAVITVAISTLSLILMIIQIYARRQAEPDWKIIHGKYLYFKAGATTGAIMASGAFFALQILKGTIRQLAKIIVLILLFTCVYSVHVNPI